MQIKKTLEGYEIIPSMKEEKNFLEYLVKLLEAFNMPVATGHLTNSTVLETANPSKGL